MKDSTHSKLQKLQVFSAIALLLISSIMILGYGNVTGHASADTKLQQLNMLLDQSQTFILKTDSNEQINISSFKISGEVMGGGAVEIYIEDNGEKFLIFKNRRRKSKWFTKIVSSYEEEVENEGELILEKEDILKWVQKKNLKSDEEYFEGIFDKECEDVCFIDMPLSNYQSYELIFLIEKGTLLKIDHIMYDIKNEKIE